MRQDVRMATQRMVPALHSCERTHGFRCDGMPCFEVLVSKHRGGEEFKYYCSPRHGYIEPWRVECDRWEEA